MSSFIINGGKPLTGEINVPGNKNAVLPAMAASLLTDEEVILENVPHIKDVETMGALLNDLGAKLTGLDTPVIKITANGLKPKEPDEKLVADLRASVLLLGPLLSRFGETVIRHPGGDIIGRRSIDEHLKALENLGVKIEIEGILNKLSVKKLRGADIHLTETSVTATENIMMAAVLAEGETQITNAAAEPHVQCLGILLNKMGAKIEGVGTSRINIQGVNSLGGCSHRVRTDHIEVGTWAIVAAVTGGEISVQGVIKEDLLPMKAIFEPMGIIIKEYDSSAKFSRGTLTAYPAVKTNIWPGFPTDLMSPMIVLATQCQGMTLAHDWMYEGR
ncbi:MAG: UDP-N-acetylglucosamine 1-carboxyvinyltransferase, partial [Patescibacteria group bacterium]|nr:UDP-N-acetylglucosamine 1-carboxyvinyltransferase [Patescibacteria group bacterium]